MSLKPAFDTPYIGRFAPSPTGPLHFGSLIAALASYLDAKSCEGTWLVRMEDIDQPRCQPQADKLILHTLEAHGLNWDGEVTYQSAQHDRYQRVVQTLVANKQAYYCTCTRKMIKANGGVYDGRCRTATHSASHAAVRLRIDNPVNHFEDALLGSVIITDPHALEDTILKRRDGLFSYNLVVVLDDIHQKVSHVVRGSDLLETTAAHLNLYRTLGQRPPRYAHFPVAATAPGRKLSKQNHAAPLALERPVDNVKNALHFLGLFPPASLSTANVKSVLEWAINTWRWDTLPQKREIIVDSGESTYHKTL